jgi:hypothetical protein
MSTGHARRLGAASLLSFQGPRAEGLRPAASVELENCTKANMGIRAAWRLAREAVLTVKIFRAYGGCLGTRSRRRTWTAAISRGEALNSP